MPLSSYCRPFSFKRFFCMMMLVSSCKHCSWLAGKHLWWLLLVYSLFLALQPVRVDYWYDLVRVSSWRTWQNKNHACHLRWLIFLAGHVSFIAFSMRLLRSTQGLTIKGGIRRSVSVHRTSVQKRASCTVGKGVLFFLFHVGKMQIKSHAKY